MAQEVQTLIEMGFSQANAEKALAVTNNKGVEPAMEWLLAHADDEPAVAVSINPAASSTASDDAVVGEIAPGPSATAVSEDAAANSLKCDECNRLFKTQLEIEYHAAKSGHSSFSESAEVKKPLTEEEKKEQLAKLEERMKQKRLEREQHEKEEAREREKLRIRSGKDMIEARKKLEDIEILKMVEDRKREKADDQRAKDRVRAQIESDKAARRARAAGLNPNIPAPLTPVAPVAAPVIAPTKDYSSARLQLRMPDGSSLTQSFGAKEQLSAVRVFVEMHFFQANQPFSLMTSFPKKVFTEEDYDKPLDILGLVPSAVVIVTKAQF